MRTVSEKLKLDHLKIIPAFQSPNRPVIEGPSPLQRLEMVRRGVEELGDRFEVDEIEMKRQGVSYTIETLKALEKNLKGDDLFLIVGADQFENFDKWKQFEDILGMVDLVVTSRPGVQLPEQREEMPRALQPLVQRMQKGKVSLKSGRKVVFVQLQDVDVSATEIRRRFRAKESVKDYIPSPVESYIRSQGLYEALGARIGDFAKFTQYCAKILAEKNGIQVLAYDLRALQHPSEFTVVASGTSTRHTQSLGETLMKAVKENYGVWPQSVEGLKEGRWVVIDYGSLIIHVFYDYIRNEYRLEELWKEAEQMRVVDHNSALAMEKTSLNS